VYELLGISLVLATLLTINTFASLLAAAIWGFLRRALRNCSARTRAEILFALRICPPVLALIWVALFLVPSYVGYEPHSSGEIVSKKLGTLAIVSAAGVAFALWRALRSWFATHLLRRKWLAMARQIKLSGIQIPTFSIPHAFPIIAVVGTFRPQLFIAERVLQTLNEEELKAAIAHERGHLAARDNFKRSVLRVCRDALMIFPCGRSLDRAWAETAECAADEHAAQLSEDTAINLASALVRIARMIPAETNIALPVAAFLVGGDETRGVKGRVGRLLEIASSDRASDGGAAIARMIPVASLGILLFICLAIANTPQVLATVHSAIERIVSILC